MILCRRNAAAAMMRGEREPLEILEILCREAADALGVPVAWVGIPGDVHETIVAASGSRATQVPIASSFAARIRGAEDLVVVEDTRSDPRFTDHPMVVQTPAIRFYAAAPLFDVTGAFAGAFSVLGREPRTLTAEQRMLLRALARHASRELQLSNELAEAGERFRDFFEQTSDLVLSLAPGGTILHANSTAMSILGIERGGSLLQAVDPERREELRRTLAHVFETAQPERVETIFVTAGGARITLEGWLRAKVMDRRAALVRIVFRDVTDRKQFEAELGNARDAALEAARVKTQFLTNVSHEIRTPMNGVVGMVDLLMATPLNEEQQDFAHQARSSATQLLSIVNNILYVSNLEAGTLSAALVDFDLYRTLQRIVQVMEVAGLGKEIEVRLDFDPALPAVFRGNLSKLRQVVTNLMDNAIKFTEVGSVVLSARMQTETETHRVVRFEVRDTGIGVAHEDRLLLFERFTQLDAASTRRFGGVGLGLATARHLVETMGGLMDLESIPGHGSTFWFTIPFPKVVRDRHPIASSELELKDRRVLVIDHHPSSRKVLLHYLGTLEMRADLAGDAVDALATLRRESGADPYDIVVFDRLNEMDPLVFAREVRRDAAIAGTSLVHLVGTGTFVDEGLLRQAGINAYTTKPVGQRELLDAISIAVAREAIPLPREVPSDTAQPVPVVPNGLRRSVRVLVAEDNFLNMKLTMSQLQKLGYVADSVANGKEALEVLRATDYDIVIMDCQMPIMDGYQATFELRRMEKESGRRHRVIALTANALEGDREKCLAAGMDDYLSKPTRHDELERALARHIACRRIEN